MAVAIFSVELVKNPLLVVAADLHYLQHEAKSGSYVPEHLLHLHDAFSRLKKSQGKRNLLFIIGVHAMKGN